MIRIERHPLVRRDLREMARHIADVSGDLGAAERRLDQVDAMVTDILANPNLGASLSADLPGWRVRHGGADRRITIVFRLTEAGDCLQIALVAFGGQNWTNTVPGRSTAFDVVNPQKKTCDPRFGHIQHSARSPLSAGAGRVRRLTAHYGSNLLDGNQAAFFTRIAPNCHWRKVYVAALNRPPGRPVRSPA